MIPEFPIGPRVYVYTAILNQTGTNIPVATVLRNSFPEDIIITWTRFDIGGYQALIQGMTASTGAIFLTTEGVPVFLNGRVTTNAATIWANDIAANPQNGLTAVTVEIRQYIN